MNHQVDLNVVNIPDKSNGSGQECEVGLYSH